MAQTVTQFEVGASHFYYAAANGWIETAAFAMGRAHVQSRGRVKVFTQNL
jgi:hypothetical protein